MSKDDGPIDFGPPQEGSGGVEFGPSDSPARPGAVDFAEVAGPVFDDQTPKTPDAEPVEGEAPVRPLETRPRRPEVMPIRSDEVLDTGPVLFDWLTEVAIPLGIFGLLGCFLYYLIDLRAALGGEFSAGLRWVCFWFLLAAILITRIRTKYGNAAVALPYIIALALATAIFVGHFTFAAGAIAGAVTSWGSIASLLFNYSLVGLLWWAAHRVTRDCTLEENVQFATGQGFLSGTTGRRGKKGQAASHPGRIILYVTAAAVLTFGLGHRALGDQGRYATNAFWCMGGYVFFALFLLAATNLSAIRMDVRKRRIGLSRRLTPSWVGSTLALALLIVTAAAFIPRPSGAEGKPLEFWRRAAWQKDWSGGWQRGPAGGTRNPPSDRTTAPGRDPDTQGEGLPTEDGTEGSAGTSGRQGSGDEAGGGGGGAAGQAGSGGGGGSGEQGESGQGGGAGSTGASEGKSQSQVSGQAPKFSWWWLLLLLLLLLLLAYLIYRYRKQIAAFFRAVWARCQAAWAAVLAFFDRLKRLLGLGPREEDEFADLPDDPFADLWERRDLGAGMTPAQIVRHVYRAFLGYCSLRGVPRPSHLTEFEFLRTLPSRIGVEPEDQQSLTNVYVFATYSPNQVGMEMVDQVHGIWGRLRPAIDEALAMRDKKSA